MSAPAPPSALPVVCALIVDDAGRILVAQRPEHKHLGLRWEFPGGKVESGETPENALIREIQEELGCDILPLHPLPPCRHDYGTVLIELIPFVARLTPESPAPAPTEHPAVCWLRPEQLITLDLAPADQSVLRHYLACHSG